MKYRIMSQSFSQIYLHLIFSTKNRKPFLGEPSVREQLYAYLSGAFEKQKSQSIRIGGVADHVHILFRQNKCLAVTDLVAGVKRESSSWLKEDLGLSNFYWQAGYGVFSISPSHLDVLVKYIANQEEHHKRVTFQDELRRICKKYGVTLDERYAWD